MTDYLRDAKASPAAQASWKNTILAGFANYIDSGSIVAGAAALALWQKQYQLSDTFVGLIAAFSANAIAAGVGALIGGRLCDIFGRKKIYQYDMLLYAFGMAWLVFAFQPWMIVIGFVLVGLAVGADIPASWSLIAETAPDGRRGMHSGVAQVLWGLGPLVVLLMSLVVTPLEDLGPRIVFAHLLVVALLLTFLRSKMEESQRWRSASVSETAPIRKLLEPKYLKSMIFLIGMYGIWNLWAGTIGFFFPYILRTVGGQSQAASVALQTVLMATGIASTIVFFMRLSDRVNQRLLFGLGALSEVVGMSILAIFPMTVPIVLLFLLLTSFGFAQCFFQLWSAELFPTVLRSTAQGVTFAIVRIGLGIWSLFVPLLITSSFNTLSWTLTVFLITSAFIGVMWGPRNEGKSLEQIEAERNSDPRGTVSTIPARREKSEIAT